MSTQDSNSPATQPGSTGDWLKNVIEDDRLPPDHAVIDGKLICLASRPPVPSVVGVQSDLEWEAYCPVCGGDGKETCNNPDHGFISALGFTDMGRLGCPVCGHDPRHKVPNGGKCDTCDGSGKVIAHLLTRQQGDK